MIAWRRQGASERAELSIRESRAVPNINAPLLLLMSQISEARQQLRRQEEELRAAASSTAAVLQQQLLEAHQEAAMLRRQLASAQADVDAAKGRHAEEMRQVEARVRAAVARKDETIAALREQVEVVNGQLVAVEAML